MRILYASVLMFGAVVLVGCTGRDTKSGTGTKAGVGAVEYEVYPTEIIVLKPGEQKEAKVSRKGKELKDADVTITSPDPSVTVEGGKFKGNTNEATVTIKAAPDAAPKEHTITVKAGDVTKTLKVRVEGPGGDTGKAAEKTEVKTDTKANEKNKADEKGKKDEK